MKNRLFITFFFFLLASLFNPQKIFAQCSSSDQCDMVPPGGCAGGSVACDDGQCVYTWQCNNEGCTSWSNWSPDPCTTGETQTRECLSGATAYQIQRCGGGPVGGGGACSRDYAGVDCPGGFEKSPNLIRSDCINDRQLLCGQPNPNYPAPNTNYWVGTAQSVGACCADNDDGDCVAHFLNEHVCVPACPAGTTQQCGLTNIGNYQKYNSCFNPTLCNDSNDVYVPPARTSASAGTCYCNCPEGERCGSSCSDGTNWVYNVITTCQNMSYACNCVPTGCTPTSPSSPTLLSPSDGDTITTTQTLLQWNNSGVNFGTGCPANNNQFEIYVGTSRSSLGLVGTVDDGVGSITFNGTSGQIYYWKIRARNGSNNTDSAVWSFTMQVPNGSPWWQVKDGDVTTNGGITSLVPTAALFDIVGLGGYPGVPTYGGAFNLTSDTSKISATRWNANTTTTQSRLFNYSYFNNLIPDDVNFNDISNLGSGGSAYSDSYHWFKATGNTTIASDINIGNRKVILFVENGNLNINGKINLNDGNGFFGAFVDGNIVVGNSVTGTPSLEGVYLSNGSFSTGAGTSQLHVRGSVASFGGINLQRNLSNNSTPAELFEFAPDQMFLFPEKLMFRRNKWLEVAP